MSGIDVHCVICDYETLVFEGDYDEENGEACPRCGSSEVQKLEDLFADHPIPVIETDEGRAPGLVRPDPNSRELADDLTKIFPIAVDHGVIDDG